jgi:hypothetical protein
MLIRPLRYDTTRSISFRSVTAVAIMRQGRDRRSGPPRPWVSGTDCAGNVDAPFEEGEIQHAFLAIHRVH